MELIHSHENVSKVFIFTLNEELHKEWINSYPKINKFISVEFAQIEEKVREAVN